MWSLRCGKPASRCGSPQDATDCRRRITPAMIKAVFDEIAAESPRNHFTLGIVDDVSHTSLAWDPAFSTEAGDVASSLFCAGACVAGAFGLVRMHRRRQQEFDQEAAARPTVTCRATSCT